MRLRLEHGLGLLIGQLSFNVTHLIAHSLELRFLLNLGLVYDSTTMEFNECDEIWPIREESSRGIIRHTDSRLIHANVK